MNVKSFGCSFVFGADLPNDKNLYCWQRSWPAHLARQLGFGYKVYANSGIGNLQIAERALIQLANPEPAFYILSWTWIDRFDYKNTADEKWHTLRPVDNSALARTYYQDLQSEHRDKLTSLLMIKTVLDRLQETNQKFIMTYMDELLFDQQYHVNAAITNLQNSIRPHMTKFDDLTFLNWSRKLGFPESENWHPLEPAHQAAAQYLIDHNLV